MVLHIRGSVVGAESSEGRVTDATSSQGSFDGAESPGGRLTKKVEGTVDKTIQSEADDFDT